MRQSSSDYFLYLYLMCALSVVYVLKFVWLRAIRSNHKGRGSREKRERIFFEDDDKETEDLLLSAPQKNYKRVYRRYTVSTKKRSKGSHAHQFLYIPPIQYRSYAIVLMSTKKRHPKNRRQRIENKELELWKIMIQVTTTMNGH